MHIEHDIPNGLLSIWNNPFMHRAIIVNKILKWADKYEVNCSIDTSTIPTKLKVTMDNKEDYTLFFLTTPFKHVNFHLVD